MTFSDVLSVSVQLAGLVLGLLLLLGLLSLRWRRYRGRPWRETLSALGRYVGPRAVIAAGVGVAFMVVVLAGLTLNMHRPPADTTPAVRVSGSDGPVSVRLHMEDCGDDVEGVIPTPRGTKAQPFARVYSDGDGFQRADFGPAGQARFTLTDPVAKRGLLSCFLQLPVIDTAGEPTVVKLSLGDDLLVDTQASSPAPTGFSNGSWLWRCPSGRTCPALATIEYAVEDGAKQVIVLVLASIFGAIIAILVTEVGIGTIKRRLYRRSSD